MAKIETANKTFVVAYPYTDELGTLLYENCRYAPKDFRQRRPDRNGGYTWNLEGVERVLYRLQELCKTDRAAWVFYCEGEKDTDNVRALGLTATTAGAVDYWRSEFREFFFKRRVCVVPHNDDAGHKLAQRVAQDIYTEAAEVRVLNLPGLPEKGGDVSDWIQDGGTAGQLIELVEQCPAWKPLTPLPLTDVGNAQRFVAQAGTDFRYCGPWGKWLRWDGVRWCPDESLQVTKSAKAAALSIFDEARAEQDPNRQKALGMWAVTSQKLERLSAMVNLARCELTVLPTELDKDPWSLNVLNGTLDLRTGELRPHRREDLLTKLAPVNFDQGATCQLWDAFLSRIMNGKPALIGYLQRIAGMCLTGDVREQVLFLFYGVGSNGKSVWLDTLAALLGEYAAESAPDLLMDRKGGPEHPTELADLCGRRLVVTCETEEGCRLKVQLLKRLTGNSRLKARFMRQDYFEFRRSHKLILATNNKPTIKEGTLAIWRRLRLVPFDVVIPEPEQDKQLLEKLKGDWPGILNWAIAGCLAWQKHGLQEPAEVSAATRQYEAEQDVLGEFIDARCLLAENAVVPRLDLYSAYQTWAAAAHDRWPLDRTAFYARMRGRPGLGEGQRRVSGKPTKVFTGIGLLAGEVDSRLPVSPYPRVSGVSV